MIYWVIVKKNLMKKGKKMLYAISYYDLLGNSKKNLIKRGKKMLNLYNSINKLLLFIG